MYGDTDVIRRRVDQLREQGADIRTLADHLVGQSDQVRWTGRAADAMRQRIRERATHLRECAAAHEGAADALERHAQEVEAVKDTIAATERRAAALVSDARGRVESLAAYDDPDGVTRRPSDEDQALIGFSPPPSGHRDWLAVDLPGL